MEQSPCPEWAEKNTQGRLAAFGNRKLTDRSQAMNSKK
jgi:hypothetical protein